jgi:hypothetical protein
VRHELRPRTEFLGVLHEVKNMNALMLRPLTSMRDLVSATKVCVGSP